MSEHLIVIDLSTQSEDVALPEHVPVNVDPVIATMISPAAALLNDVARIDVATVIMHVKEKSDPDIVPLVLRATPCVAVEPGVGHVE